MTPTASAPSCVDATWIPPAALFIPSPLHFCPFALPFSLSCCHWAVRVFGGPMILLFSPFTLSSSLPHCCLAHCTVRRVRLAQRAVTWPNVSSFGLGCRPWAKHV